MARDRNYLQLFMEVSRAISKSLNTDDVFGLITRKIPEVVGVDAATVRLLDASGKKLVLKAASGLSEAYLNRGPIDAEPSVFRALEGEPIAVADAASDPRISYPQAAMQEGIKSILVVPIPIRGKINGILRLLTRTPRTFAPEEIDFVVALGEQCGIALENARVFEEQQQQLDYFKALNEIGQAVGATYELDRILDLVVTRLPEVMKLKAATIRLIEPASGRLQLRAAHGLSRAYLERGPLDDELSTYYVKQGDPVVIPDARVDIHTLYHKEAASEGVASILAVPITYQGETIGILRLLTREVRYFTEADIKFAMTVAEQTGVAVQRAVDYAKLQQKA